MTANGEHVLQIEMGSLNLLGAFEAQNGALQTLGIDMFAAAKQASHTDLHSFSIAYTFCCVGFAFGICSCI